MTEFEEACAALVASHPDLAPPRVVVSEMPRPYIGTMQWCVELAVGSLKDDADRSRACSFLREWIVQHAIEGVEVVIYAGNDFEWLLKMVELEERLGPFPPNGAAGIASPRAKAEYRLKREELMRWEDDGGVRYS